MTSTHRPCWLIAIALVAFGLPSTASAQSSKAVVPQPQGKIRTRSAVSPKLAVSRLNREFRHTDSLRKKRVWTLTGCKTLSIKTGTAKLTVIDIPKTRSFVSGASSSGHRVRIACHAADCGQTTRRYFKGGKPKLNTQALKHNTILSSDLGAKRAATLRDLLNAIKQGCSPASTAKPASRTSKRAKPAPRRTKKPKLKPFKR